mmetsp:Transcript_23331/g.46830  ORF Transcript_23331/g.46830 Transcript_23331/m.46830 type:complete len:102 (+) Transcript_23331:1069-1374(+)
MDVPVSLLCFSFIIVSYTYIIMMAIINIISINIIINNASHLDAPPLPCLQDGGLLPLSPGCAARRHTRSRRQVRGCVVCRYSHLPPKLPHPQRVAGRSLRR